MDGENTPGSPSANPVNSYHLPNKLPQSITPTYSSLYKKEYK